MIWEMMLAGEARRAGSGVKARSGQAASQAAGRSAGKALAESAAVAAVAASVALATIPGCSLEDMYKYSETTVETRTAPLAGIDTIEMRLGAADIQVVTKEGAQAEFIIEKTARASEKEETAKLLREAEVTIEQRGSRLVVERKEKSKIKGDVIFKGFVSLDITVSVPAGISLDVLTGSGDVVVDNRAGAIKVRSGSGDVTVEQAGQGAELKTGSGDIRLTSSRARSSVSTGSGDIFVTELEGGLEASTGSGEINIERLSGDARLSTGSGDISVASSSGTVSAESGSGEIAFGGHRGAADVTAASGDISFGIAAGEGTIELETSSGEVAVLLYAVDQMDLDVSTVSGAITCKVPIVVKQASRRRLLGVQGAGGFKLAIETTSGDVYIDRGSI
jgi:hypothetical protein